MTEEMSSLVVVVGRSKIIANEAGGGNGAPIRLRVRANSRQHDCCLQEVSECKGPAAKTPLAAAVSSAAICVSAHHQRDPQQASQAVGVLSQRAVYSDRGQGSDQWGPWERAAGSPGFAAPLLMRRVPPLPLPRPPEPGACLQARNSRPPPEALRLRAAEEVGLAQSCMRV